MPYSRTPLARALVGSPLRQPLVGCMFWVVMLVLIGIALLGQVLLFALSPWPALLVAAGVAALATLASLPALALLGVLDRRERESIWLFGGAVLWGAVVATGLSGILNSLGFVVVSVGVEALAGADAGGLAQLSAAALVAPPVEEAAKGVAILALFWFFRAEFDNLRDGIIYGALIGLGFNIAETALYVMNGFIETGTAPVLEQFATRFVFLGLNGHLVFSALCGAGVGLARQTARAWLRLIAPVAGYVLAVMAHGLHNSVGAISLVLFLALLGVDMSTTPAVAPGILWLAAVLMNVFVLGFAYLLLVFLLGLSAHWERAVLRQFLADEIACGTVTADEYAYLVRGMPLFRLRAAIPSGGRTAVQIANAQAELAFRKWHVVRDGHDPASDELVAAWRHDIATLRGG